jgi:hypothetical protein
MRNYKQQFKSTFRRNQSSVTKALLKITNQGAESSLAHESSGLSLGDG